MMRGGKILVCVLGSIVLSTGSKALVADTQGNPYEAIVQRNLFNLKPPIPPPAQPPPPAPQPPKLFLTSLSTILGKKLVTLSVAARPGQPAQNLLPMTEGQAQDGIEVVSIDENAQTVAVKNNGVDQTLDFVNNGMKAMATAPPPVLPVPGGLPMPPPTSGRPAVPNQLPVRDLRAPGQPVPATPEAPAQPGAVTPMSNTYTPAKPTLTPEEQIIMIEAQRMHYQEQGDPIANIFPPTELTAELTQ